jgi:hypothetical protein
MRTSKYSEEQVIGFLRQAEAGIPVKEIGRKHGSVMPAFTNGVPSMRARTSRSPNSARVGAGERQTQALAGYTHKRVATNGG